ISVQEGEVDLSIEKKESPDFHEPVQYDPLTPGANYIVYQIDVRNAGPSLATGVTFADKVASVYPDLGQQLTFVRDTANSDGSDSGSTICTVPAPNLFTVNSSAPNISCNVGDLEAGASYTRYLVFNIEDAPHLVTGDVYFDEVNVTALENETGTVNNYESERTTVRTVVDVALTKSVSKSTVEVEEPFTFILDIINHGPGWAPNTLVSDTLPADMELTGTPTSTQGICTGVAGDTDFMCNINDLNNTLKDGLPVQITVPVKMTAWPASGSVTNTATVSTDGPDSNSSNDEGSATVNVYEPAQIGNYVWEDMNADGIQEAGEPGISGVVVTLLIDGVLQDGTGGTALTTATTDAGGHYVFDASYDLKPNHNYSVQFALPANYIVTKQNATTDDLDSDANAVGQGVAATPVLYSGDENSTLDAGLYQNAALGNRIWLDSNGNGVQDGGEIGVDGVTVTLFEVGNSTPLASQSTAGGGLYLFENLRPGAYYVEVSDLPADHVFTGQNEGINDVDSDIDPLTGRSDTVILTSNENNSDTDAGIYIPASIGDYAWLDINADGNQDGGEPGLADINVTLIKVEDNGSETAIATVTTDSLGAYRFDDLRPGNYYLQGYAPANYDVSPLNSGDTNTSDSDFDPASGRTVVTALASGENDMTWDGGLYETASIGNRIWLDRNADGIQDADELNVTDPSIIITLLDENNATVDTQSGVTNGYYGFDDIVPGIYHLSVTLPGIYSVSPQDANDNSDNSIDSDLNTTAVASGQYETESTVLVSGENDLSWDIGIYESASIGNKAWLDLDADGIQDFGEPGLADINVTLYKVEDNGSSTWIGTETTDANGSYGFDNLVPGDYYLVGSAPEGYYVSPLNANGNSDEAVDSDFNATTGSTGIITLESGETDMSWDGGLYELASIGDFVWIDTNGDGIQNDGELLDVNVTVNLYYENNDSQAGSAVVAAGSDGSYLFEGLVPDLYYLEFTPQAGSGYLFISPNQGSDDREDSDVNQTTGRTQAEQLTSGENNTTFDAGIYRPASFGDRVWLDADADGIQEEGEVGLSDVTVTLLDNNGNPVGVTVTDENGSYLFDGLVPGTYSAEFNLTDENGSKLYMPTLKNGTDEERDSDINATGVTEFIDLVSGEYNQNVDAGVYIPVSIGDYV
ncbi:MAG: SdrD B-like domain-containing protein, partial [Sulfurovum sp.]